MTLTNLKGKKPKFNPLRNKHTGKWSSE